MARIYICYSRADYEDGLVGALMKQIDHLFYRGQVTWDEGHENGDKWWRKILREIKNCDIFVYLLSSTSAQVPYCVNQYKEARRLQKLILVAQINGKTGGLDDLIQYGVITHIDISGQVKEAEAQLKISWAIPELVADVERRQQKSPIWQPETPCPVVPGIAQERNLPKKEEFSLPQIKESPSDITERNQIPEGQAIKETARETNRLTIIGFFVLIIVAVIAGVFTIRAAMIEERSDDSSISELPAEVTPQPGYPGGEPITANDQWTPILQEFSGIEMVLVPHGCFRMGSSTGETDEQPMDIICVETFLIDVYEVTNAQFERFNGEAENGSRWPEADRPRESITWFEARDFCILRGARLPTEAEWEYAARGPDSLRYTWGDQFVAANVSYAGNTNGQSSEVGDKPGGVSWVGAYDVLGNVWEWSSTIYHQTRFPYPYRADDGRENAVLNSSRVLRGGSWLTGEGDIRVANRPQVMG